MTNSANIPPSVVEVTRDAHGRCSLTLGFDGTNAASVRRAADEVAEFFRTFFEPSEADTVEVRIVKDLPPFPDEPTNTVRIGPEHPAPVAAEKFMRAHPIECYMKSAEWMAGFRAGLARERAEPGVWLP